MLAVRSFPLIRCTEASPGSESCAFKKMWFDDIPLFTPVDSNDNGLTIAMKSSQKMCRFITDLRTYLFNYILAEIYLRLLILLRSLQSDFIRIFLQNRAQRPRIVSPQGISHPTVSENLRSPTLSTLPTELRIQIYGYAVQDTAVSVVGYRSEKGDAFYFKQRGLCPLMLTCKQFHYEGMRFYFDNLTVEIKAASPSQFAGDMSAFGGQTFRDSLRRIYITDDDDDRRLRIQSAFKNAQIKHSSRLAWGSRKGAYYFG